jgi:hypothetical protein
VLIFDVVPRSRSSGGERPPHTRKVTGSIPVGTTIKPPVQTGFLRRVALATAKPSGQYPAKPVKDPTEPLRKVSTGVVESVQRRGNVVESVQRRGNVVEFVVIEIGVDVRGHGDRRVAHRLL